MKKKVSNNVPVLFGITIFISAFLLFLIQPLFSKFILPWYGGSTAVWTTCMLFFQSLLLLGYGYAHFLTRTFRIRTQVIIHCSLLALSLLQLPPIPAETWKFQAASEPVMSILKMLFVTLGLPYMLLSATSPLLQRWFTAAAPKASPYRLYALSNVGSLLALISFPFFIEPNLTRNLQAYVWAWGMGAFVLSCAGVAFMLKRMGLEETNIQPKDTSEIVAPTLTQRALWILLPAAASLFLLATTNKLCQEVVVIPMLWIFPLALYLLTFIICFDKPKWYSRTVFLILFILSVGGVIWLVLHEDVLTLLPVFTVFPAMLFIICMICHGEVARIKPHSSFLTSYYLHLAFGGVIGSIFVVVISPLIFNDYSEYHVGIFLCMILLVVVYFTDKESWLYRGKPLWAWGIIGLMVISCGIAFQMARNISLHNLLTEKRSFYGAVRVGEIQPTEDMRLTYRTLNHGLILHGMQFTDSMFQQVPTTYYSSESGLGLCFKNFPKMEGLRVGAVGLGVGTVASWIGKTDYLRVYEINPDVVAIARGYFFYLKNIEGKLDIILGDARLSMEREPSQQFDVLVLDAFNSDSPPVHLLTEEAFQIYLRQINASGVIAIHISCKHLDFLPVLISAANHFSMQYRLIIDSNPEDQIYREASTWLLMSNNLDLLNNPEIMKASEANREIKTLLPWTDDYSSLVPIFIW